MSTVQVYDETNATEAADLMTAVGEATGRVDASGQDQVNEDGVVNVTVAADHPSRSLLVPYKVLRLVGSDGEPRMAGYISKIRDRPVAPTHAGELVDVEATGLLGLLLEQVVVPWGGVSDDPDEPLLPFSPDRVFNALSPGYDRSSWITPFEQSRDYAVAQGLEYPIGWTPESAKWIWSAADSETQPVGRSIFHTTVTTGSAAELVPLRATDNEDELWWRGTLLDRSPLTAPGYNWYFPEKSPLRVQAETVDVGLICKNYSTSGTANPAATILAVWTTDGQQLVDLLRVTDTANWTCLHNPDPWPGWTCPDAFQVLLDEAQDRGAGLGWTINVVGTHEQVPELVFRNGTTYRDVLRQMSETWVDVWADTAGLVLHMAPKSSGGRSQSSAVDLQPGVNITSMSRVVSI